MNDVSVSLAYAVVAICASCFLLKIALDLRLPYSLIAMREKRAVSWFWFVELLPLGTAVAVAWAAGLEGWFSPAFLGIAGLCLMAATFGHLFAICTLYGVVTSLRRTRDDAER